MSDTQAVEPSPFNEHRAGTRVQIPDSLIKTSKLKEEGTRARLQTNQMLEPLDKDMSSMEQPSSLDQSRLSVVGAQGADENQAELAGRQTISELIGLHSKAR